jgi:conjugative relaxase-like TrwC/TraI family protein
MNTCASAAAAKSYYTQGLSREDYYSHGQETPGRWAGLGALRLGLSGLVEKDSFSALCDNINPQTGERLTARTKDNRRIGYDLNFHAPKSVSLIHALNGDTRILDTLRAAVDATMREVETAMKTRVRGRKGLSQDRTSGNLIWAEFVHFTGRPVGGIPDPHLHAHCFAFNATYDGKEKRWKAGQFGDLQKDARYYEAAFHARLARGLHDLGYGIARHGKGWEIAGISREHIERFSRRQAQIEETAKRRGITDAKGKDALGAKTREHKRPELSSKELLAEWRGRLSAAELADLGQAGMGQHAGVSAAAALAHAQEHLFERSSAVSEKALLEAALRRGVGSVTPEEVREASAGGGLLWRTFQGERYCTSRQVLQEEREMIDFARDGRGRCTALSPAWKIQTERLGKEQRRAVLHVAHCSDRVMAISGGAGTGKTTMMQEAVAAIQAGGREVFTFAPSAGASRGVLREAGFTHAETVARLLKDTAMQQQLKGQVMWVDEAGLLGVQELHRVFQVAKEQGARVILSGDTGQHGAVARGDALRLLSQRGGVQSVALTEIKRQSGIYRQAVQAVSRGDLEGGFSALDKLGKDDRLAGVVEMPEEQRYKHLAADYLATVKEGKSALVVSPTHQEGAKVTELIRETLRRDGRLGKEEREFTRYESLRLTESERRDAAHYRPGLVVTFQQNAKGFQRGERCRVIEAGTEGVKVVNGKGEQQRLSLEDAGRFQVYRPASLRLAAGDAIRITENGFTADRKHRLNNGALYTVHGFSPEGGIHIGKGRVIAQDFGKLAHGYCTTSHASQGKTVKRVFIAQSTASGPAASREQLYVSVSRGQDSAKIYTDDKAALMRAAGRSGVRLSAQELAGERKRGIGFLAEKGAERIRQHAQMVHHLRDYAGRVGKKLTRGKEREEVEPHG